MAASIIARTARILTDYSAIRWQHFAGHMTEKMAASSFTRWYRGAVTLIYLAFLCLVAVDGSRKVKSKFPCQGNANVIQSEAEGVNSTHDTLHYLLSTHGLPTILVLGTQHKVEMNVNCTQLLSDNVTEMTQSITLTDDKQPLYSYAFIFTRLLEYNDTNDTASMTGDAWASYPLDSIFWLNSTLEADLTNNTVNFTAIQDEDTTFAGNGSVSLILRIQGKESRSEMNPHLSFTGNTTHVDLILDNLSTNFTQSRFALEMVFIAPNLTSPQPALKVVQSIDDEHSPGVFELVNWRMPWDQHNHGGYVQWKPVCYMQSDRTYSNMNRAKKYDLTDPSSFLQDHSVNLAYAWYGQNLFNTEITVVSGSNVSFGLAKDKFYEHTNYTVWMASLGYGKPPEDTISTMVIIIISIGLGLPVILIIFGSIGVCIKRHRESRSSPYVNINE